MDASEIRFENFKQLYAAFRAEHMDKPERGMLKLFAEKVVLSDRYLSHIKCGRKQIGHANARIIEAAFGKPEGWLDKVHDGMEPVDHNERAFIETALAIYRSAPAEANALMIDALKRRLAEK